MGTELKNDVRDDISQHLKSIDRSLRWLCRHTGYNYNTMYSTFVQKVVNLTDEKLEKINAFLGTDFTKG